MPDEEKITFDHLKSYGIDTQKIIINKIDGKTNIFLELQKDSRTKKQIGQNIDNVVLYGIRPSSEGPYFITIIEEGILNIYDKVYHKIVEKDHAKSIRLYIPIW